MFPWNTIRGADPMGASEDAVGKLKKGQATTRRYIYIGAAVFFLQLFLSLIAIISYLLYPRTNGVHILKVETVDFKCPAGSWITDKTVGTFGKCYLFRTGIMNVAEAEANCLTFDPNAHLVTIKSAKETEAIKGHHEALGITTCDAGYWTSGRRPSPATVLDEFYWYDGSDVRSTYNNWEVGQPDTMNSLCLLVKPSASFMWSDRGCTNSIDKCFICEL